MSGGLIWIYMELFKGIDLAAMSHEPEKLVMPDKVPNRVCHIDADFLAYQVTYDDEKALSEMKHNWDVSVEKMRLMSGSETVKLHLTPTGSDKGGRYDIAMLKEYQGNRKDKPKPKFLNIIREWAHKERAAILHMNCEADDGMSIAQYKAIAEGNRNLSIIATKDKDLTMVPGLMLDWDTGEITDCVDSFGYIMLDDYKSQKKIRGRGWKYFWAQMLTGDQADNISGLPKVYLPQYLTTGKPKPCGPVMAYDILLDATTNKQAFELVKSLYQACGKHQGFTNYRDGSTIKWGQAFLSEAQLLWMRRDVNMNDVAKWLIEFGVK